ncbi:MAG TPA: hypothetical protein VEK07_15400 [Polyangiaceae bacterium]|nr:hypothetical protein [Polyangiaceae bacterium]
MFTEHLGGAQNRFAFPSSQQVERPPPSEAIVPRHEEARLRPRIMSAERRKNFDETRKHSGIRELPRRIEQATAWQLDGEESPSFAALVDGLARDTEQLCNVAAGKRSPITTEQLTHRDHAA